MSARLALSRLGINRSTLVRVLMRLGAPNLRELRARAIDRGGLAAAAVHWLEAGTVTVPAGHGQGLVFDLRYLPLDHAHLGSIASGWLETSVQEALVRHLGPGDVLYDIGANVGFFSLLGARLVGPSGAVYALEPAPENVVAIRHHVELNALANLSVLQQAAAARPGRGRLQLVDDRSWSKLEGYGQHPGTERVVEVELVAVDDLKLRPPTLVKIDIEGAELAALEGMAATLERHRPAVICELHGTHAEFAGFMSAHGYRVVNLEGPEPIDRDLGAEHALALPALDPGD